MRRLLGVVALLAGLLWIGLLLWAGRQPETEARVRVRTGAFCVAFIAGMLAAPSRRKEGEPEEW